MHFDAIERVRVSRVRVNRNGKTQDFRDCWITVNSERQLGIWLDARAPLPSLTVPLVDAMIDWEGRDGRDVPLPTPP